MSKRVWLNYHVIVKLFIELNQLYNIKLIIRYDEFDNIEFVIGYYQFNKLDHLEHDDQYNDDISAMRRALHLFLAARWCRISMGTAILHMHRAWVLLQSTRIFWELSRTRGVRILSGYAADNNDNNDQHDLKHNHLDQHNNQHDKHCAANNDDHDYGYWYYDVIDYDNHHDRAAMHRDMYMALVRRLAKMDQGLWR